MDELELLRLRLIDDEDDVNDDENFRDNDLSL